MVYASEENVECDVVAIVFDINICMEDIKEKNERLETKFSHDKIHSREKRKLAFKIRAVGVEKLLNKKDYTPSLDEINAHIAFTEKFKSDKKRGDSKIVNTIKSLLETYEYEEKNRLRLEKAIETFEYSLKEKERNENWHNTFYGDIEKRFGKDAVEKMKIEKKKRDLERPFRFSKKVVESWKMNKALFDKYGGRIVFQQFGIEPIDAYQALIEDIKNKGKLKIIKSDFENIFAEQEAYNKSNNHTFIPKDSFSTPYWELENNEYSYKDSIRHYKSIPHK